MAFMKPQVVYFTEDEATEFTVNPEDCPEGDDTKADAGFYGRLSAPGYMDCTDWNGPWPTEAEALTDVMETYEVDENGDSLLPG